MPEQHVQRLFDAVEPQYYDRIGGGKDQLGFIAQDVQAAGKLGETLCKTMSGEEELLALDYQKLGGPVGRGEVPAEAGRQTREETGIELGYSAIPPGMPKNGRCQHTPVLACLKNGGAGGHRAAGAAGPGLQRAGSPQALPDRLAGVPGPAGLDECAGHGGPAGRCC